MSTLLLWQGCATKQVTPLENRVLNPFTYGCTCLDLTDWELGHFLLVGDKKVKDLMLDREQCIEKGLLELNGR